MSTRFDAAQEWIKRKDGLKPGPPTTNKREQCLLCAPRSAQDRYFARRGRRNATGTARLAGRYLVHPNKCWKSSGHVGTYFGISGSEVRVAANVIYHFRPYGGRAYFARFENEIERMIGIEQRLRPDKRVTSPIIVRIIKRLIKHEIESMGSGNRIHASSQS